MEQKEGKGKQEKQKKTNKRKKIITNNNNEKDEREDEQDARIWLCVYVCASGVDDDGVRGDERWRWWQNASPQHTSPPPF